MKTKKFFYFLLFILESTLPAIASLILFFQKKSIFSVFIFKISAWQQIIYGTILGFVFGFLSYLLIRNIKIFKVIVEIIENLLKEYRLNIYEVILISFWTAVCEEILFRGVLQQLWGILLSSFVFILLHGYFNPFNLKISIFGCCMFLLSMFIGLTYKYLGILAAILFHGIFDFTIFYLFYNKLN